VSTVSTAPAAIVTGAGAGIGEATARLLLERGYRVVAADVSTDALAWTRDVPGAVACVADVSAEADNAAMVATAVAEFGRLDVMVLNAGIARRTHWEADDAVDAYDRIMAVNARGVVLGIRHGAPQIAADGGGAIVVVASTSGVGGDPERFAYNASKAAAINLARAAALDWAVRGVRVNAMSPGPTMTSILQGGKATPEHLAEVTRNIPMQRMGTPEEQAEAICFLASPAASFITGAVLMCDGGVTANAGIFPPPQAP
jgi:meso-butanediol dehydrogenase / (S,S)-butanediol dehydrogenase / diacetyl reductase